jgi:hypothetical protein
MNQSTSDRRRIIQRKLGSLVLTVAAIASLLGDASVSYASTEVHAKRRPVKQRVVKKSNLKKKPIGQRLSITAIGWGGCTTCGAGQ